jgi:hypothetical protein
MTNKSSLSAEEISALKRIRNYFGENDKTSFEHWAWAVLGEIIKKSASKETEKPEDVEKLAEDWQKRFIDYCMVKLEIDVEEIYSIIDYLKEHGYNAATGTK